MAPKNLLKIDDILTGPKISSIASNRGRAFNLEREACTLAQASELLASSLVVKTFSKAAAERLRLIKRQLRLTSD